MTRTVFVKDPGHHLWIGINVWRGDITVRSQQMVDAGYELARHALQFALRHMLGITIHTTFGAAEGDVHQRRLPGHRLRQRSNLLLVHGWEIADAAFSRSTSTVVLNPIAQKDPERSVVHADGDFYLHFAKRGLEEQFLLRTQAEGGGCEVEIVLHDRTRVCHEGRGAVQA